MKTCSFYFIICMKTSYLFILLLCVNLFCLAQSYIPNDAKSKTHFTIKNFGIKTGGIFSGIKGSIDFNPKDLSNSQMNVSVNAGSINTDNNARDKHLRKSEYFNVEKYPLITFKSSKITESSIAGFFFVVGTITIKGITKILQFGFTAVPFRDGYTFNGEFDINRLDFGVGSSSISLSDNLKVTLNIVANK